MLSLFLKPQLYLLMNIQTLKEIIVLYASFCCFRVDGGGGGVRMQLEILQSMVKVKQGPANTDSVSFYTLYANTQRVLVFTLQSCLSFMDQKWK